MLDLTADLDFDAVGGLTLGADPVATAMLHAAAARGRRLDAFVVRKEGKAHGLQRRIEGPDVAGRRVLAVEDTSTTGGSVLTAVQALREAGAEVVGVAVIVERGAAPARSRPRASPTARRTSSTTSGSTDRGSRVSSTLLFVLFGLGGRRGRGRRLPAGAEAPRADDAVRRVNRAGSTPPRYRRSCDRWPGDAVRPGRPPAGAQRALRHGVRAGRSPRSTTPTRRTPPTRRATAPRRPTTGRSRVVPMPGYLAASRSCREAAAGPAGRCRRADQRHRPRERGLQPAFRVQRDDRKFATDVLTPRTMQYLLTVDRPRPGAPGLPICAGFARAGSTRPTWSRTCAVLGAVHARHPVVRLEGPRRRPAEWIRVRGP